MQRLKKIIFLLLIVVLTGCGDDQAPVLKLGTNIWPGYEPLYLARHRGDLSEKKIHLVEYSSASQVIQAFRNRLIDAAALTLDEALSLLETGEKITVVLVMDISNGGDAIIGKPAISSMAGLKGKRIGVESNALGAYVIARALEKSGIDSKSVTIVNVDINEQEKAFKTGKVDAVVTFDPVRSKLLARGGKLLFDSRQLPGEIVDVLVVRNEYLEKNPQVIRYLLNSWYKTLEYIKQSPGEAAKVLKSRMKLSVDETLSAYEGLILPGREMNRKMLGGATPTLRIPAGKLAVLMLNKGLLRGKVDPSVLFRRAKLFY